ncbi:NAD(P)-dependent oxidoreductase [Streptomyces sp. NPDC090119]|uniref:NAD(P)-dependent oxidoreductase n=1 Tax=Streptomyces sp. NPDC090119 TaxID=3365951 RepID=UPI0038174DD3
MSATTGAKTYDVAVLGCGPMGAALARNFAAKGRRTAAWNRSPAKAEVLAPHGVTPIQDIDEVVRSSKLVVACLSTYDAAREALADVTDWSGTTLVNVGTGAPAQAEEWQAWTGERGVPYLDGAILCYPPQIGTEEGLVLYSGSPEAWAEHEQTLMATGVHATLVSSDVKAAGVLDAGIMGAFYVPALNAYVEAATYALDQGVVPETFDALSEMLFQTFAVRAKESVAAIASDQHETDIAHLSAYAEGSRAGLDLMRATGFKARLLKAAVENLNEAEEAGLGGLDFSALTKVARTGG